MPTYQYICKNCGNEIEELQSMNEPPLVHCPKCKTNNLARVMGSGGGLIFKGSGFYLTDYRKDGTPKSKPSSEQKESKEENKKEKKDVKPEPPSSPKASSQNKSSSE